MARIHREEFSARIEAMDSRIDARFETIDARFEAIDARFEAIDARFEAIDGRFEAIDARFEAMDARIDTRFQAMDARIDSVRIELGAAIVSVKSELREDIHKLRTWVLSGVVASLASVLGLIGMNVSRDFRFHAIPVAAVAPAVAADRETPVESPRHAGASGDIPLKRPPVEETGR